MVANCPFCLSDNSEMYFMRDKLFTALYNRSPILPGHSLIVPNRHVERFNELTEDELKWILPFTKSVVAKLSNFFPNTGFDWTIQDGNSAGQTVGHFHIHLIPRRDKDLPDPGDWYPLLENAENQNLDSHFRSRLSEIELLEINKKLRS